MAPPLPPYTPVLCPAVSHTLTSLRDQTPMLWCSHFDGNSAGCLNSYMRSSNGQSYVMCSYASGLCRMAAESTRSPCIAPPGAPPAAPPPPSGPPGCPMAAAIGLRHDLRVEYDQVNDCGQVTSTKACYYSFETTGYTFHPCVFSSGKCATSPTARSC